LRIFQKIWEYGCGENDDRATRVGISARETACSPEGRDAQATLYRSVGMAAGQGKIRPAGAVFRNGCVLTARCAICGENAGWSSARLSPNSKGLSPLAHVAMLLWFGEKQPQKLGSYARKQNIENCFLRGRGGLSNLTALSRQVLPDLVEGEGIDSLAQRSRTKPTAREHGAKRLED
jgi:hypothetical protein